MMHYTYDLYGRFAGTSDTATARSTPTAPPEQTSDYNWSGSSWVFAHVPDHAPMPSVQPVRSASDRHITKLAFRNRFTLGEKVMMEIAALDNPNAAMPARQQAAALRANLADTAAATFIDLGRADTRSGVQMLEAAGLLGAGRALIILDAPILPGEQPL